MWRKACGFWVKSGWRSSEVKPCGFVFLPGRTKKWRRAFETDLPGLTTVLTSDLSESGWGNLVYNASLGKKFWTLYIRAITNNIISRNVSPIPAFSDLNLQSCRQVPGSVDPEEDTESGPAQGRTASGTSNSQRRQLRSSFLVPKWMRVFLAPFFGPVHLYLYNDADCWTEVICISRSNRCGSLHIWRISSSFCLASS